MQSTIISNNEQRLYKSSLFLAPFIFSLSTFFWKNGEYGVTGGTFLFFASVFWIPAFIGLFGLLKHQMPVYAIWGLLIAIFSCFVGANFGFVGIYSEVFNIDHQTYIQEFAKYPVSSNILLFATGPLFPLSVLVLSINLWRTHSIAGWISSLLCVGAIIFPLSRISRIPIIAHIADLFLLIPLVSIARVYFKQPTSLNKKRCHKHL